LQRIGVVPHSASLLIDAIEADGGAAKISGAGATRGDAGGLVIAYQPDEQAMSQVMSRFPGYTWGAVEQDSQGACYVGD
jgi:mevalonate kinase